MGTERVALCCKRQRGNANGPNMSRCMVSRRFGLDQAVGA
jgi:hypothetical protein